METFADLKRRCTPGTVVETERLHYKPVTYFAVVAECSSRHLGLVTADRSEIGYTEWGAAKTWQITEDTATKYSREDEPVALVRFRFLSEKELADLPEDVKGLSQRYRPETATTEVVTEGGTEKAAPIVFQTATFDVVTLTIADDALTDDRFWEAQQSFHTVLLSLSEAAALQSTMLELPRVSWQSGGRTDPRVQLQKVTTNKDGEFTATLVVKLPDALQFYSLSGSCLTPRLKRLQLADCSQVEPFKVQTQRGTFERLRDGKYTNGAATYDSLLELSKHHSWTPLKRSHEAAEPLEHHAPYSPATAVQKAARIRPIAETDAPPVITEAQFWNAQQTVHQCLLELSEAAPPRQARYTVSTIRFHEHPQVEVRDVQVSVNGDWQATLVVHQPKSLWLYALTGDQQTYHPERLSLADTEKRVRCALDTAKYCMPLRALLKSIQALPTTELKVTALLLLSGHTIEWLKRTTQQPTFLSLAEWLQDLEIRMAPQRVLTTDGLTLERQPDGSYSDDNLTYGSLADVGSHHDWEEVD